MKKTIVTFIIFLIMSSVAIAGSFSLRALTTIPADSLNAESMRIWVPIKKTQDKVKIFIRDQRQNDIRQLYHDILGKGYYNFYWDKKDDSGRFVPEGRYFYYVMGGYKTQKEIVVKYSPGENLLYYKVEKFKTNFEYEIVKDTVLVSLIIENNVERIVDTVFIDSTFNKGIYQFNWEPSEEVRYGRYKAHLSVNGYPHKIPIRYTK